MKSDDGFQRVIDRMDQMDQRLIWGKRIAWFCILTAIFVAIWIGAALLTGCSTVAPAPIVSTQASFDGTNQDSGIKGVILQDGTVLTGTAALANLQPIAFTIISESARDRYNALVDRYGKTFLVPITRDFGVTLLVDAGLSSAPLRFSMTAQATADFAEMERMFRSGK